MSEKPEGGLEQRVKELSERYSFHLERWTHGRTPIWARGAFDPREVVEETLVEVARHADDLEPGSDDAFLGRVRRALYDKVVARVRLARSASTPSVSHVLRHRPNCSCTTRRWGPSCWSDMKPACGGSSRSIVKPSSPGRSSACPGPK